MFAKRLPFTTLLLPVCLAASICASAQAREPEASLHITSIKQGEQFPTASSTGQGSASLPDGEYLIDSQQLEKGKYSILTKLIQIRLSNHSQIILQAGDSSCRVGVIKGDVTIKNLSDHNIIKVSAGAAYETAMNNSGTEVIQSPGFLLKETKVPVFQTARCSTSLFSIDAHSTDLQRLLKSPEELKYNNKAADERAQIISPPTICNYQVGSAFGKSLQIPSMLVQHFPPNGLIPAESQTVAGRESSAVK